MDREMAGAISRLLSDRDKRIAELERVTACLLDHYLGCYDTNFDRLAIEAARLVPDWERLKDEWKPE